MRFSVFMSVLFRAMAIWPSGLAPFTVRTDEWPAWFSHGLVFLLVMMMN